MFPVQMPRVRVPCTLNSELTGSHTVSDYNMVWPYDRAYDFQKNGASSRRDEHPRGLSLVGGGGEVPEPCVCVL